MAKILITAPSFEKNGPAPDLLRSAGHQIFFPSHPLTEAGLIAELADKDAYIAGLECINAAVIRSADKLKIIARYGAGYNRVDLEAAKQQGVAVTNTPGANAISVAELAFGLMLALSRSIPKMDAALRTGTWAKIAGPELAGKTLGIVGLGAIGGEVAKRARAFSMKVIAYDICLREEYSRDWGVTYLPLAEVIAQSDFLSLHAPAVPETIGLINQSRLAAMKKTAYLINTARGELVVEADLIEALQNGVIAGAALDTYVHEPIGDNPLITLPNVVLTPHAGSATAEASSRVSLTAAQEVVRVLAGEAPHFRVN